MKAKLHASLSYGIYTETIQSRTHFCLYLFRKKENFQQYYQRLFREVLKDMLMSEIFLE